LFADVQLLNQYRRFTYEDCYNCVIIPVLSIMFEVRHQQALCSHCGASVTAILSGCFTEISVTEVADR